MRLVRHFCFWLLVTASAALFVFACAVRIRAGRQLVIEVPVGDSGVAVDVLRVEGDPSEARIREIEGWIADAVARRDERVRAR